MNMILSTNCKCNSDALEFGQHLYLLIWFPFTAYFHISMIGNMIVEDDEYKAKFFGGNCQNIHRSKLICTLNIIFCNYLWVIPAWEWLKTLWAEIAKAELKVRLLDLLVRWIYLSVLFSWSFTIKHSLESKLYCFLCISQWLIILFEFGVFRFGAFYIMMIIPITLLVLVLKCWIDIRRNI